MLHRLRLRQLLFIDTVGASLTALSIGGLFATEFIATGIPSALLWILSMAAVALAGTGGVSLVLRFDSKRALFGLACLNLAYCLVTALLWTIYFPALTWIGVAYFPLEIIVITILVSFELRASLQGPQ